MRKLLPLLVLVIVGAPGAAAKDCSTSSCGVATVAVPGSTVLAVRPSGARGPLQGYDLRDGRRLFSLPAGLLSGDGRTFLTARRVGTATALGRYDARTGRSRGAIRVEGAWSPQAVSANGGYVVLARSVKTFHVVETKTGKTVERVTLPGRFEAEAIDDYASRLFLVEHREDGYVVRSYEFATRRVGTVRVKGEPPLMDGVAARGVASPEGRWLLTLYFAPDGEAAVHTLDVMRGTAVCIDIPTGAPDARAQYALALAPDGTTVYATNAALGVVATIDLAKLRVTRVVRFAASTAAATTAAASHDAVWFSSGSSVFRYDVGRGDVGGPWGGGAAVTGIGFAPGDRRVVVVRGAQAQLLKT